MSDIKYEVSCIICNKKTEDIQVQQDGFIYLKCNKEECYVCCSDCLAKHLENLREAQ